MPNFTVHLLTGFLVFVCLMLAELHFQPDFLDTNLTLAAMCLLIIPTYAIFPDIDQASSNSRKLVFSFILAAIITAALYDEKWIVIGLALFMALTLIFAEHRGLFHSLLTGLLISAPLVYFDYMLAGFAFISYYSHLLLDRLFTKKNNFPY
jgi:hypothetical protein